MEVLAPESLARGRTRQRARAWANRVDRGMPAGVDISGADLVDRASKEARDYEVRQEREYQRARRAEETEKRRDEWLERQRRISEAEDEEAEVRKETAKRIEDIKVAYAERLSDISFGDVSAANSLAAVGGFIGGQSADNRYRREQAIQELQADRLRDINDTLKDQDERLAEIQASVED